MTGRSWQVAPPFVETISCLSPMRTSKTVRWMPRGEITKISSGCGTIYRVVLNIRLVGGGLVAINLTFSHINIGNFIIPIESIDFHIFQRGGPTTNQLEGCGNLVFYFTTWIMINIHNLFCCVNCCSFHLEWQKIRKIKQSFYGHPKSSDVNICKYD